MKISVVIPSFHQAKFLDATLESVCAQSYPDMEVLVFDGGSTDGSLDLLQRRAAQAGGAVIRWVSRKNAGREDAVNQGLRASQGEVLACLHPGDVFYPGTLWEVAARFRSRPDRLALYGRAYSLHPNGSILDKYPTEPWNYDRLLDTCFLCQPAVFWRREVIARFGVFDDSLRYARAYEYWLRVGRQVPFEYLDGYYLAGSRARADAHSSGERVAAHLEIARAVKKYAPSPDPVLHWIKRLARQKSQPNGSPAPTDAAGRQRYAAAVAAHCFLYAHELDVTLTDAFLEGLENDLGDVNV